MRVPAAADQVDDGHALGRDRVLRQQAQGAGDLLGRQRWIASPSSSTAPDDGRSSRASPRSSVDLPQALAPTITVIRPSGTSQVRSSTTARVAVPERDARGPPAGLAGCGVVGGSSPPSFDGAAAGEQPEQERRTEGAGDDADRAVDVGAAGRRRRSRRARRRSPPRPARPPSSVVRPPLRARAIGPDRKATNATGPAAATATATSSDASEQQQRRCGRAATPRPAAVSSPSSVDAQRAGQPRRWRAAARAGRAPSSRIAGQSAPLRLPVSQLQHQLDVVLVGAGEEVAGRPTAGRRRRRRRPARAGSRPRPGLRPRARQRDRQARRRRRRRRPGTALVQRRRSRTPRRRWRRC